MAALLRVVRLILFIPAFFILAALGWLMWLDRELPGYDHPLGLFMRFFAWVPIVQSAAIWWTGDWSLWWTFLFSGVVLISLDVIYNCTIGSLMFWEVPPDREALFTSRLQRHVYWNTPGIGFMVRLLNAADPGHIKVY